MTMTKKEVMINMVWRYDGPVTRFGKYVGSFKATTEAPSEAKALSNLRFRYNKSCHASPQAKVELDKKYLKGGGV